MRKWLYYTWWKTKAIRHLVELTNCKPYHAMQFVNEITKSVDDYIWVPADPEKFISFEVEQKMTKYKHVTTVDALTIWYASAKHGQYACYGIGRPTRAMLEQAAKLGGQLFQKRVKQNVCHYLIRKVQKNDTRSRR